MNKYVIGLDIGGTKCAVALGEIIGNEIKVIHKVCFRTEVLKGVEYTMQKIYEAIDAVLDKGLPVSAIGISCGGPLDSRKGIIMSPPNLPGWNHIPIKELFEKRYNIPTGIQNDANACALAEWQYGAGRGYSNVIFLTFGTGMGAGLILNGQLYTGTNDMAGEVGHIRLCELGPVGYGKAGSFEGFCSGGGIAQFARTKVLEQIQNGLDVSFCKTLNELDTVDAKTVAEAAQQGDALAIDIYKDCGTYLGKALSILIDVLNPEEIILGSIYNRVQSLLEPTMRLEIEKESLRYSRSVCRVVPSGLGDSIGDVAALSVASNLL